MTYKVTIVCSWCQGRGLMLFDPDGNYHQFETFTNHAPPADQQLEEVVCPNCDGTKRQTLLSLP